MVKKITDGWKEGSVNIDIGGGKYDTLSQALADEGVKNYIYEPYGRTANENAYVLAQLQSKTLRGDTATCSNVLNVIKESDIRANVVHQVAKAIKPDGVAYFTIYEGNKSGRGAVSKKGCWQNNRKTATYVDEVRQHFGDVQLKNNLIIARGPLHTDIPARWLLEEKGDVWTFSVTGGKKLAAVHTLSAEKFLAAVELGGMPMPSVAVTRLDRPYEWGGAGAINLIGKPEMVDPRKGADVYSSDAWAGTMPLVERRPKKVKAREVTFDDLYALDKQYGTVTHGMRVHVSWDDEGKRTDERMLRLKLNSKEGAALFAWQSGYRPRAKKKDAERDYPWLSKELAAEFAAGFAKPQKVFRGGYLHRRAGGMSKRALCHQARVWPDSK